jgi:hypothetical protein
MLRFLFTLLASITFGRWIYSEVKLVIPSALPTLDFLLQKTEIPTHDQWSQDSLDKIFRVVGTAANQIVSAQAAKASPPKEYADKDSGALKLKEIEESLRVEKRHT